MWRAYRDFWRLYFNFSQKSSRADFAWVLLVNTVIYLLLIVGILALAPANVQAIQDTGMHPKSMTSTLNVIGVLVWLVVLYYLASLIPWLTLEYRRMKDIGLDLAVVLNVVVAVTLVLGVVVGAGSTWGTVLLFLSFVAWGALIILCLLPSNFRQEKTASD